MTPHPFHTHNSPSCSQNFVLEEKEKCQKNFLASFKFSGRKILNVENCFSFVILRYLNRVYYRIGLTGIDKILPIIPRILSKCHISLTEIMHHYTRYAFWSFIVLEIHKVNLLRGKIQALFITMTNWILLLWVK